MAKSRAQQAAIAISMKKAGKKPKRMLKGGKSKTLSKVSKQLAKASKLHAAQSKKIGKLADTMQEGGYPKSSNKEFMRRMGYYQAGGLQQAPMYGANTLPGVPETSSITYQEADPAKLKAIEEDLKAAQESTKYQDEAQQEIAKQEARMQTVQGIGEQVLDLADKSKKFKVDPKTGEKIKDEAGNFMPVGVASTADPSLIKTGADLYGKGVSESMGLASAPKGVQFAVNPATGAELSILPGAEVPAGFEVMGVSGGSKLSTGLSKVAAGAKQSIANLGSATAGTGAAKAGEFLTGSITGGTSTAASMLNPALVASLAGMGVKKLADDDDATTMNVGETTGSLLQGLGTGAGIGGMIGGPAAPVTALIGGIIGAGVSGIGGLVKRGKARKEMAKAERKKRGEIAKVLQRQKMESLKAREYSGFDFGKDVARYGGYYQTGGAPGVLQNMPRPNIPMPPSQRIIKQIKPSAVDNIVSGVSNVVEKMGLKKAAKKGLLMGSKLLRVGAASAAPLLKTVSLVNPMQDASDMPALYGTGAAGDPTSMDKYFNKVYQRGGVKLPGGKMKPIPGSDAVEFKGRSHEQGGIMLDPMTEVEGGETMDKVTMKKGGVGDYFFSQHLKMGGKSFAQRHKDILKNGGRQKDIDALAKLQEKKAGRNPNVVKLGAGGYYQLGGVDPLGNVIMSDLNMDGIDDFSQGINLYNPISGIDKMSEELNLLGPSGAVPPASKEEEKKVKKEEKKEKEGQEEGQELFYPGIDPNKYTLSENVVPNPFDDLVEINVDPNQGVQSALNLQNQINEQLSEEDQALIDKAKSNVELTEQEQKALKRLNRNVPGLAIAAGVTQLLPAAYSFFKKDKPVEQMGAPGRIKAPALDRVNFNAERAANAADNRAINRFIETSGIGPAGIIAKMSAYRRKQEGDMKIAAQESRINTQIANREAQMQMQARTQNIQNALRVNQINTAAREAERIAQSNRRLGAVDTFAQGIAGLAGDAMSYQASERLARATGDMGIYERDRLRNFLRNQINPRTGQPYTNADIAELFNKRFAKPTATKEDDKKEDK
tara:strand:- start:41564 stop:44728 length:3165 start_codon:yes stop_codon:yes gene_type:complete